MEASTAGHLSFSSLKHAAHIHTHAHTPKHTGTRLPCTHEHTHTKAAPILPSHHPFPAPRGHLHTPVSPSPLLLLWTVINFLFWKITLFYIDI